MEKEHSNQIILFVFFSPYLDVAIKGKGGVSGDSGQLEACSGAVSVWTGQRSSHSGFCHRRTKIPSSMPMITISIAVSIHKYMSAWPPLMPVIKKH